MQQKEADYKTISKVIDLIKSSECDILHISWDQLEETKNQLGHTIQLLKDFLVTQNDTETSLPVQAYVVANHPEAQVVAVCTGDFTIQVDSKPKSKNEMTAA
jgi:prefoldin subunit 5